MNHKKPATLKSYGRAFQTIAMSAAADARIRRALDVRAPRKRRWVPFVWALPLAAACGLLAVWVNTSTPNPQHGCEIVRESMATRYVGRCDVDLSAMTVHLEADAKLVQNQTGVSLMAGTAHFGVRKVRPGEPPVEVRVPEASIVVLGTEFTVTVTDQTSQVDLRSGHVRFVHQGRGAVEMWPGQRLTFETRTGKTEVVNVRTRDAADGVASTVTASPLGASDAAATATPAPLQSSGPDPRSSKQRPARVGAASSHATTTAAPPAPPSDLQLALELRAQGRYEEALARLSKVSVEDAHASEVVDFERATLTELQAPERACARYREHLARFPNGRYRAAVLQKLARCVPSSASSGAPTGGSP